MNSSETPLRRQLRLGQKKKSSKPLESLKVRITENDIQLCVTVLFLIVTYFLLSGCVRVVRVRPDFDMFVYNPEKRCEWVNEQNHTIPCDEGLLLRDYFLAPLRDLDDTQE